MLSSEHHSKLNPSGQTVTLHLQTQSLSCHMENTKAEGDALPDATEEPGFRHVLTTDGQECAKSSFFNTDSHSQCILVQLVPLSH